MQGALSCLLYNKVFDDGEDLCEEVDNGEDIFEEVFYDGENIFRIVFDNGEDIFE